MIVVFIIAAFIFQRTSEDTNFSTLNVFFFFRRLQAVPIETGPNQIFLRASSQNWVINTKFFISLNGWKAGLEMDR